MRLKGLRVVTSQQMGPRSGSRREERRQGEDNFLYVHIYAWISSPICVPHFFPSLSVCPPISFVARLVTVPSLYHGVWTWNIYNTYSAVYFAAETISACRAANRPRHRQDRIAATFLQTRIMNVLSLNCLFFGVCKKGATKPRVGIDILTPHMYIWRVDAKRKNGYRVPYF